MYADICPEFDQWLIFLSSGHTRGQCSSLIWPSEVNSNGRTFFMKKSKFRESPIVAILKEIEFGAKVDQMRRKYRVSRPPTYGGACTLKQARFGPVFQS